MTRPRRAPTRHELDVLAGVLREGTTKGAACSLGLAESTVKAILATVRAKAGAANTTQAVWILRRELEKRDSIS